MLRETVTIALVTLIIAYELGSAYRGSGKPLKGQRWWVLIMVVLLAFFSYLVSLQIIALVKGSA